MGRSLTVACAAIMFVVAVSLAQEETRALGFGPLISVNIDAAFDGTITDHIPRIATDGDGNWVVVWRTEDQEPSVNDATIFAARSSDNGDTWAAAQELGSIVDEEGFGFSSHDVLSDPPGS